MGVRKLTRSRLTDEDAQQIALMLPALMLIRDQMRHVHDHSHYVDEASAMLLRSITSTVVFLAKLIA